MSLHRADADRDAPRANAEDNAARVRPGVEGKPPDGLWKAGVSLPSLGRPSWAPHAFPVSIKRASARESRLTRGQKLHCQQSGRYSDRTGEQHAFTKNRLHWFPEHHKLCVTSSTTFCAVSHQHRAYCFTLVLSSRVKQERGWRPVMEISAVTTLRLWATTKNRCKAIKSSTMLYG